MTAYLLDTNILSDLVRNPQGAVADHIAKAGETNVATSIIVASELRLGAAKRDSARLTARVEAILAVLPVLALEPPADQDYGDLRTAIERKGTPIGANDMLIAAHALATGRVLVTDNVEEFRRVPKLKVVNWLR